MAKLHPDLVGKEFWYEDITLVPTRLPDFERDEVVLTTYFTKRVKLKTPFVSSPMDTVTGSDMAILMALMGGIGVIHYNHRTIYEQIKEAEKVKRFEAAFVIDPIVLGPTNTVGNVYKIAKEYGFYSVPITQDGTLKTKMIGFVTHRDVRYVEDMSIPLEKIMTPKERLITAHRRDTLDKNDVKAANKIIREYNLDTLPIVDDDFHVVALVTDSDIQKDEKYTLATKDDNKQLKIFIAVESRLSPAKERIGKAYDAGVDGVVVDASIVFKEQIEIAKYCKQNFPRLDVVLGNVDSAEMVRSIITEAPEYCDALRVGIGPGYACKTQQELGTGRAQASAVWDCAQEAKRLEKGYGFMPIIADGGIRRLDLVDRKLSEEEMREQLKQLYELGEVEKLSEITKPGDITKALALGGDTVMMGSLLASLDESPGEKYFDYEEDRMVKKYRGMGSLEAMEERAAIRYGYGIEGGDMIRVEEGIVTKVPYRGSGYDFIPQLIAGVKQSMQKLGFRSIPELQEYADIRPMPKREK
ncbi:MAG: IMP dehydrogenase [Candidatus Aenigmarchaeota archaeon]|nr:IMP dehydrogenase [Candidatus Aenigmarchaeota archaeon]